LKKYFLKFSVSLVGLLLFSTGCSVYQSEGRKYLEKQAFEFAGVAATENLLACDYSGVDASWVLTEQTEQTDIYVSENQDFKMKVQVQRANGDLSPSYGCGFQFGSAQEMYEKSADAAALTLFNFSALP